jgi:rhodanese-related sulfurtransferase
MAIQLQSIERMELRMRLNDPAQAREYFERKMAFTTGPAELKYLLEQGAHPNIIDVRRPEDYAQGHIPGAINLPEEHWNTLKGLSKDRQNIVCCYSAVCHLAARACISFARHGFSVMELDGGMESWREYEYDEERGYPAQKTA